MVSLSIAFLIALAVTAFITPWVRRRARNWGAVDDPSRARKIHTAVIPRMGGLAIAAGFFAALFALLAWETQVATLFASDFKRVIGLFGGAVAMLALGVYDDFLGANAKQKLLVQVAATAALCALGFTFDRVALPWGGDLRVGVFGVPLTFLWVVGITNAINLIDGLDGLAAGVCLFAVAAMCVVSVVTGQVVAALIAVALAGALVGFLFHNFHPATIFMGDTGSLFIGFVVAATALITNTKSSTTVALLIPVTALGLPIMDTTLATFRRVLRGQSPFSADQEHIHHRLMQIGLTPRSAVLALWGVCLLACFAAAGMVLTKGNLPVYILAGFAFVAAVLARSVGYLRVESWPSAFLDGRAQRKRRRSRHAGAQALIRAFSEVATLEGLFDHLRPLHRMHDYASIRLDVWAAASTTTLVWERDDAMKATADVVSLSPLATTFEIVNRRGLICRLTYRYLDGRARMNIEDEQMLALVHGPLAFHVERVIGHLAHVDGAPEAQVIELARRRGQH
jgi:UDP-GlcNAc:undecaprenyl-phosphate GlcNAc-1-phosphate transferase